MFFWKYYDTIEIGRLDAASNIGLSCCNSTFFIIISSFWWNFVLNYWARIEPGKALFCFDVRWCAYTGCWHNTVRRWQKPALHTSCLDEACAWIYTLLLQAHTVQRTCFIEQISICCPLTFLFSFLLFCCSQVAVSWVDVCCTRLFTGSCMLSSSHWVFE